MNRQTQRRKARKKQTTYTLTSDQIASIAAEEYKKAYKAIEDDLNQQLKDESKRLTKEAYAQTFYIPLLVLRNQGWGKIRLQRFAEAMIKQTEFFEEHYFTAKDVEEMIKEETGIDLKFELDFKNKKTSIKVVIE